jgi:TrmH family RNA methyltransferase
VDTIGSRDNARLKRARGLHNRRQRIRSGRFLAEGEDVVEQALGAGLLPEETFVSAERPPDAGLTGRLERGGRVSAVPDRLLADLGTLEHPARVICVFATAGLPARATETLGLHLHAVSDPGNVGTAIRGAAAFGPAFVQLSSGSADPTSARALRASMGALFRVPCEPATEPPSGFTAIGLDAAADTPIDEADLTGPVVLVVGSERAGLPAALRERCDRLCAIPIGDGAESLNAAQAATVALYVASRQRARR